MASDRRRATRHARSDFPLARLEGGRSFGPALAFVLDASLTGLGVEVAQRVLPGQLVRFHLTLPSGALSGTAEVRWSEAQGTGYRCGLRFQRLRWWQCRRLRAFLEPGLRGALGRIKNLLPLLS